MVRWLSRHAKDHDTDDLKIELLFDDPLVVSAGTQSRWARRRKIDFRELIDAPWLLPADTWSYSIVAEAFQSSGLKAPTIQLVTMSVQLRAQLLADSACVTVFPTSVARRYGLKILPVDLPAPRWQVAMITLKDRALSPVVEGFIERCREISKKRC
jgi:DNA-binding transcriptional LysR family regulator